MASKYVQSRKIKKRTPVKLVTYPAILGDGAGNVAVTGRANYVYARVGDNVEQVFNNRVPLDSDIKVTVGRDEQDPQHLGTFQVLSVRTGLPGGPGGGGGLGYAPSRRYRWQATDGGQDPLWVEGRQILPFGVYGFSGLTVQIQPGFYFTGEKYAYFAYSTKNLTSYVPATSGKALLALLAVSIAGVVTVTLGSEFTLTSVTTLADLMTYQPEIPAGTAEICAFVRLYNGQTAIQEGRNTTDIFDPRMSKHIPTGSGVAIKSADYTLTTADRTVVFTATATATLPNNPPISTEYRIICRAGTLTIDGDGSDTIKGSATQTLSPGEDLIIQYTETGVWE